MKRSSSFHAPLSVATHTPLASGQLRAQTDPLRLRFDGNEQEATPDFSYHQPRAERALALGLRMKNAGHIFVCGPPGTARKEIIEAALKPYGKRLSPPQDYVALFPTLHGKQELEWLALPAGRGRRFVESVDACIQECQDRLRQPILSCSRAGEPLLDEAGRTAWNRSLEEDFQERLEQFRREGFDSRATECFENLGRALAIGTRQVFELSALHVARNGSPKDFERMLDRVEQLAALRPQLIRESTGEQAPVVFEPNPTYHNLFGCVVQDGNRFDGFQPGGILLQPGSLLSAQGGTLILDFEEVASEPDVWRHLKRCLRYEQLEVPILGTASGRPGGLLKPKPIPLKVKLVVWGDERLYQEFYERDPAFGELFKIRADLDSQMDRNDENIAAYVAFLRKCCDTEGLTPFHPTGVASFVDAGAELAGRQKKLTTRWNVLAELIREASFHAEQEGSASVQDRHVDSAQKERRYRRSLPEQQLDDLIRENSVLIQTEGAAVGQVNGIALYETEDHLFGKPCRITAQTGMGRSGVINIEREVNLSGKIHDKGVLILCGFLRNRFAQDKPLTLGASLCIEQFYSEIDGDSASLGEICALLSSLANVPVQQGIAVTGSISQKGDVQTIGCANEKIIGFFDVCSQRGLTGNQGVIIPAGNVEDLMLPQKIVRAAEAGDFRIYAVKSVDQAMEILTGCVAGEPDRGGRFPQGSLNGLIDERLWELATGLRDFLGEEEGPEEGEEGGPHAD